MSQRGIETEVQAEISTVEVDAVGAHRRTWLRIAAGCLVLVAVAFIQSPGLLVADTKFDLVADPLQFLSRALHLWDADGAFGQLQNQAYGYLWPMGPFYVLGAAIDLPGWVIQRLWEALVMCVAFVGLARLARAFGVRSDFACLAAAFAYAVSPRIISTLGPISIEAWPSALAPWVLLPLVIGASTGSPRRAAFLSAVAVSMVGGVNAAATSAVLPLGVLWLLTRKPGPRRRSMMLWWPLFTALGTLWWLIPLFLMGAYSPPFLDFIESASVTTQTATIFDALRGTTAWVPYIEPSWRGGNFQLTNAYLALNSALLLIIGVIGLAVSSTRERTFLFLSLCLGLFLTTMGHAGTPQGWFADPIAQALDGLLSPIRNIHKFDPVVRIPMVLGVAWALQAAFDRGNASRLKFAGRALRVPAGAGVAVLVIVALLGTTSPAWLARLAPSGGIEEPPAHWAQAARWLDDNAGDSVSLVVPGSSFAEYRWGNVRDEPLQFMANSPWAVRSAVPLTPPGNIRMLDAIESRLIQGRGSAALASYLRRAGVGHLVVRNDLETTTEVPEAALVREAVQSTPGVELVATFGPALGVNDPDFDLNGMRVLRDGGWEQRRAAIEIYQVNDAEPAVGVNDLPVVAGGPEDLLRLGETGVLGDQPTRLAVDVPGENAPVGPWVLTDGYQDRERGFGRVHDGDSAVRLPADERRTGNRARDYRLSDDDRWRTTARLQGAESVSASGSGSDATALGGARTAREPFAALDGDPETSWSSEPLPEENPWWRIDFDDQRSVDQVRVTVGEGGSLLSVIRLVSDLGQMGDPIAVEPGETVTFDVAGETVNWLRIEEISDRPQALALAEVEIDALAVTKELVLPEVPAPWQAPDVIALGARWDGRTGCAVVAESTPCLESRAVRGEEAGAMDRVVRFAEGTGAAEYRLERLTARPRAGAALTELLMKQELLSVSGSSTGPLDARASELAAVDGDPGTAWTPELRDTRPSLSLNWIGERRVSAIRLTVDPRSPVRAPRVVTVSYPEGSQRVRLDAAGFAELDPFRSNGINVAIEEADAAASVRVDGTLEALPIGVSEIKVRGPRMGIIQHETFQVTWPCGSGPTLQVGGRRIPTAVVASEAQLSRMEVVPVVPCSTSGAEEAASTVELGNGENQIRAIATEAMSPVDLVLARGAALPAATTPVQVRSAGAVEQVMESEAGAAIVVRRQNVNPGWRARQGGDTLAAVTVDGWQQAWRTNGSTDPIRAEFTPDRPYRWGLLIGALALLALWALLLLRARRWPGADLAPVEGRGLVVLTGAVAVLSGGVLAGWTGLGLAALGWAGGLVLRRLVGDDGIWLLAPLLFAAGFAYFVRPFGSADGWAGTLAWPHYLVVVVVAGLGAFMTAPLGAGTRRRAGRSTSR